MRRRVSIGKLGGHALAWHDATGVGLATWVDWIAGLRLLLVHVSPCLTGAYEWKTADR